MVRGLHAISLSNCSKELLLFLYYIIQFCNSLTQRKRWDCNWNMFFHRICRNPPSSELAALVFRSGKGRWSRFCSSRTQFQWNEAFLPGLSIGDLTTHQRPRFWDMPMICPKIARTKTCFAKKCFLAKSREKRNEQRSSFLLLISVWTEYFHTLILASILLLDLYI